MSQGYLLSTDNNYLAESTAGSFEFFEAGINLQRQLTDHLRVGMQLFARDLGPLGDYKANIDWAFLDYRWRDWLGLRAGRIKLPFGLYNDTSDIDAAHPVALLPQSVYPAQNRDFLLAQTGLELYGYHRFDRAGAFDYRAYAGTIFLETGDATVDPRSPFTLLRLAIPYVIGARVLWEVPKLDGVRVGASVQRLRLETEFFDESIPGMPSTLTLDAPVTLGVGSVEYIGNNVHFAAEYARWHSTTESSNPLFDGQRTRNERAYWLAAYRVRPWLQPGMYYSLFYPQAGEHEGKAAKQHDLAATVRFDLNLYWLLKFEVHHMRGVAALTTSLNPPITRLEQLADRWWLFVVKTTVFF